MGVTVSRRGHVAEVEVDYPPVNALPVRGWFDLADALRAAGADADVHAVVLAAAGRGFNAGVESRRCSARRVSPPCWAPTAAARPRSPRSTTARCRSWLPSTATASVAGSG